MGGQTAFPDEYRRDADVRAAPHYRMDDAKAPGAR